MTQRRILVTRSAHQASALAEALHARGFEAVVIPTIELAEPSSFDVLDSALKDLNRFDWLVFTSANAVEAFQRRRVEAGPVGGVGEVRFRIAAIGPSTARTLQSIGLSVDVQPVQAVAESLAEALVPYALQANGAPAQFLLVRAEEARDVVPQALAAAGAEVTIAAAYRTRIPQDSLREIKQLFSVTENYPDAVTFTSSSTSSNLIALLEAAGLTLPESIPRISIGPITSETLCSNGLPPHAEAVEATVAALADAVQLYFNKRA